MSIRIVMVALSLTLTSASIVLSQSQSRNRTYPTQQSQGSSTTSRSSSGSSARGSTSRLAQQPISVIGGYCVVCLKDGQKWTKGSQAFASTFDGRTYLFPDAQTRQAFQSNPINYMPALHGHDIVIYANQGRRVKGNLNFGMQYKDRYYFFTGEENRSLFRENPEKYANADLAYNGNCAVCLIDTQQQIAGNAQLQVVYQGIRYAFPGAQQRDTFLANPAKYALRPRN